MTTISSPKITAGSISQNQHRLDRSKMFLPLMFVSAMGLLLALTGCDPNLASTTTRNAQSPALGAAAGQSEELTIREGDTLKVSFPGTQNLDTTQQVRRDGRITLLIIGELKVVGFKPSELEKELVKLYSSQLVSKEVSVAVESSSFAVYVTGSVLRPGKIVSDRPISVLEAIMEAGGFAGTMANMKAVVVIRKEEDGRTKNYTLNLRLVLEGKENEPFYLKPSDIVYVPERFSWF
jgi:polysaccharide export outer membrane protein